jgi:CRISPR-associated protein Csb1
MTVDLEKMKTHHQLLFAVPLEPVQGRRFQPTGFPDLGAATYETPGGLSLLVESAQSMANRFEAACWNDASQDLVPELKGLSYVRVVDDAGKFLTSSVLEAHRLNSVYIEKADGGKFHKTLEAAMEVSDKRPLDRKKLVETVFKYDAGSLVHGVFLESIDGRLRVARALTAFIEADDVKVAASGGVKNDRVKPGKSEGQGAAEGFGNVPFHRDEYTGQMTLYVNVDLAQIRGYGLGRAAETLLVLLSLYKVRALLDGKLRLRTACDLKVRGDGVMSANIDGFELPKLDELKSSVTPAISECASMFGSKKGVTEVTYKA